MGNRRTPEARANRRNRKRARLAKKEGKQPKRGAGGPLAQYRPPADGPPFLETMRFPPRDASERKRNGG
jgi:hypothetical protein